MVIRVGKNWVEVGDLRCCLGSHYLKDVLLNVAWNQICKELQSSYSPDGLKVGYFPSFFFTKLLQEGNSTEEGYGYDGVHTWLKTFLGDMFPLDYDIIVFLRNVPLHWFTYVMFPQESAPRSI